MNLLTSHSLPAPGAARSCESALQSALEALVVHPLSHPVLFCVLAGLLVVHAEPAKLEAVVGAVVDLALERLLPADVFLAVPAEHLRRVRERPHLAGAVGVVVAPGGHAQLKEALEALV